MRKVCIITTVHSSFDTRIFHKECKALVKGGYHVTLICQHDKNLIFDGVQIIALSKAKSRIHRMLGLTLKAFYLALKQRSDIYHFHDPELLAVGILLKIFKKKVICDVHEDYPKSMMSKYYLPKIFRKFIAFIIKLIQNSFAPFFDYIIVAGDDIAESMRNSRIYNKMIVLKNVPPKEFINTCKNNIDEKKNNIVYAGILSAGRGIREIVEAMRYVNNNVKLFLIGSATTPQFEQELCNIITDKVDLVGKIDYEEIPNFINVSKIGLICFHSEPNNIGALSGRNNKLYEYMAGGLAIIASNFPEWRAIVEGNNIGITVNPENPKEIAEAINYLMDNPCITRKMGENGIKLTRNKYNWEIEKEKLLRVYDYLLK